MLSENRAARYRARSVNAGYARLHQRAGFWTRHFGTAYVSLRGKKCGNRAAHGSRTVARQLGANREDERCRNG